MPALIVMTPHCSLAGSSEMSALQAVMTMGEREARGWVHNEMFLSLPGRRRLTAGALGRLMRREGLDDDIEALLDYRYTTIASMEVTSDATKNGVVNQSVAYPYART